MLDPEALTEMREHDSSRQGRWLNRGEADRHKLLLHIDLLNARIAGYEAALNGCERKLGAALGRLDLRQDEDGGQHDEIDRLTAALQNTEFDLERSMERENAALNARIEAERRLDYYRRVLEEIVRDGSDTYGIVSVAAQHAGHALNVVLDNTALAANPSIVVEKPLPICGKVNGNNEGPGWLACRQPRGHAGKCDTL